MTKLSQAIALATAMTAGLVGTTTAQAEVEVSASASIANMYLWRGTNLGSQGAENKANAIPAVSGDLQVSASGAYAGVWTSSGDATYGQEYDIYVGYGDSVGDFSYDLSVWTYVYPDGGKSDDTFGDSTDIVLGLGFKDASFGVYKQVGDVADNDNIYYTLGYGFDKFSATVGMFDQGADDADYTHLDVSYAYNDNLSFTLSKIVDQEKEDTLDDDTQVVVSYSLPIEL